MFKKVLLVLCVFSISFAMEEAYDQDSEQEERSITEFGNAWRYIANYLPGNDLFLNTDIARNIELDKKTRIKIVKSFLKTLKKMNKAQVIKALESFFKTSNLELNYNLLNKVFDKEKNYIKHSCFIVDICAECKKLPSWLDDHDNESIRKALKALKENKKQLSAKREACLGILIPYVFLPLVLTGFIIFYS